MEYLLILNTFRIPRSSLDIQDGIYGKAFSPPTPTPARGTQTDRRMAGCALDWVRNFSKGGLCSSFMD